MIRSSRFASRLLVVSALVGCLSLAFLAPLSAKSTETDKPKSDAVGTSSPTTATGSTPPAMTTSPTVTAVTQAAVQSGVLVCASRINQLMTFLTTNTKSSAYLFTPPQKPDQSIFSVSLGMVGQTGAGAYASASFAPTTGGQSAAVYDMVQYTAQPCAEVEKTIFKSLKRKGILGTDIVMLDGGAVTVFLMPAGSGCIIIRKEVVQ